jgi:hypothetical protein
VPPGYGRFGVHSKGPCKRSYPVNLYTSIKFAQLTRHGWYTTPPLLHRMKAWKLPDLDKHRVWPSIPLAEYDTPEAD